MSKKQLGLATAAIAIVTLSACGPVEHPLADLPTSSPSAFLSPSPSSSLTPLPTVSPGDGESRVEVPDADFGDAKSVAKAFYTAWDSYDGTVDTDKTVVDRYSPYVTDFFLEQYEDEGMRVPADIINGARESNQLRTIDVTDVSVPDGAPNNDNSVIYHLDAVRTIVSDDTDPKKREVGMQVRVEKQDNGKWLVAEVYNFAGGGI